MAFCCCPNLGGAPYVARPLSHAITLGFYREQHLAAARRELIRSYYCLSSGADPLQHCPLFRCSRAYFRSLTLVALLSAALVVFSNLPHDLTHRRAARSLSWPNWPASLGVPAAWEACWCWRCPVRPSAWSGSLSPGPQLADRIVSIIEGVEEGLRCIALTRPPGSSCSLVARPLECQRADAFYVAFSAFGIAVSYWGALLLQGLLVLGISVPSTPGFFGVFEAVVVRSARPL